MTIDRPLASVPALPIPVRMRANTQYKGSGVCMAIVDSGFVAHPDLTMPHDRIMRYVDARTNREYSTCPTDVGLHSWHGTMAAVTAAGTGYLSKGHYTSLAPEAKLVLLRTMEDNGNIRTTSILSALRWILRFHESLRINVVNISVYSEEWTNGSGSEVNALVEELTDAGVCVVAAAGNTFDQPVLPPASAESAITVGGLNDNNTLNPSDDSLYSTSSGPSSIGRHKPDLIAPAILLAGPILHGTDVYREAAALCAMESMDDSMLEHIFPLLLRHTQLPLQLLKSKAETVRKFVTARIVEENIINPFYKYVDGTSFASPIVTSIVAQMLELAPALTPGDVKSILMDTAKPVEGEPIRPQGRGVVQQVAALEAVKEHDAYLLKGL